MWLELIYIEISTLLNLESMKPVGVLLQGTLFSSFSGEFFFKYIF
jgi:hypothetical protein